MAVLKKITMMTTCRSITNSPDYAYAQSIAYDTVLTCNQKNLPISVKKIIRDIPNLHIQKYTSFAKKNDLTLDEVYEELDSEEGCLWMRKDGQFIIFYNDTVSNIGRSRFTIAHELGHYLLKHNELTKKTNLSRYSLSESEYDIFEKEANYFAKRLLAPIPLVDTYLVNWETITAECIEFAFDTSYTVALHIINDIDKRYRNSNIVREHHPMVNNFIDFINRDSQTKLCLTCKTLQPTKEKFCKICSGKNFLESAYKTYTSFYLERTNEMKYSGFKLNEFYRATTCPKCGNEQLTETQNACQVCGTNIMNRCLGEMPEYPMTPSETIQSSGGCGQGQYGLSGDARFCPFCGGITSFYYQRLLKSWEDEKEEQEKRLQTLPNSFSNNTSRVFASGATN